MPAESAGGWSFPFLKPLVFLLALASIYSVGLSTLPFHHVIPLAQESGGLWSIVFGLILTWWLYADRAARKFKLPYEFEYFVLFAWPIVVPYYMYRRLGSKGVLFGLCIWGLFFVPHVAAAFVFVAEQKYSAR